MSEGILTKKQVVEYLLAESDIREGRLGLEMVYGDCLENPYIHVRDTGTYGGFADKRIPPEMRIHLTYFPDPLNKTLIEKIFGEQEDIEIRWAVNAASTEISRQPESLAKVSETLSLARKYHGIVNSEGHKKACEEYWDKTSMYSNDLAEKLVSESLSRSESSSQ